MPWAGGNTRRLLFAAFTIAYLCLLRVDEVLKIKFSHLKWDTHDENLIVLTLPFRKTSQNGGESFRNPSPFYLIAHYLTDIKPFVLHRLPDYFQHLCPVRALCDWILASQLSSGYVFRKMLSGDRFSTTDVAMVSPLCYMTSTFMLISFRQASSSWSSSGTVSWTSGWIRTHMEPTPSVVVGVSFCMVTSGGACVGSVTGEDGALISLT